MLNNDRLDKDELRNALEDLEAEFEKLIDDLIVNSQISFDNKSIIFDREWFYKNVELKQKDKPIDNDVLIGTPIELDEEREVEE